MTPKLIKTPLGHFAIAEWNGVNESGIVPFGDRVLIFPDQAADQTAGGIMLPEQLHERLTQAAETGVLIAMGDDAWIWSSDRARKYEGKKPQIGQRVIFERYAGSFHEAPDGRCYRLMDDKCVGGLYVSGDALGEQIKVVRKAVQASAPSLAKAVRPPLVAAR